MCVRESVWRVCVCVCACMRACVRACVCGNRSGIWKGETYCFCLVASLAILVNHTPLGGGKSCVIISLRCWRTFRCLTLIVHTC